MAVRETIQLERESFGAPIAGSLLLHVLVIIAVTVFAYMAGRIHGSSWGSDQAPGAIQATLVSSAPTIPIPVKQPEKKAPEKKQAQPSPKHAQPTPQQNRANFGEAPPTQIPHSSAGNPGQNNPVNVNGGDFGSRFPWYVDVIRRKTAQNWLQREVAPETPAGARVYLSFVVSRDGSPSQVRIAQSSGSPTLDSSCLRAVQRVDTYGPLPPGYNGSTLSVSYYCEEPGH